MKEKKKSPSPTDAQNGNFLDYIPVRSVEWKEEAEGKICLIRPRTGNRLIAWLIKRLNVSPWFYIHLDVNGSAVWREIDGEKTVGAICGRLKERGDLHLPQPEQQVSMFLGMLRRNDFIRFKTP